MKVISKKLIIQYGAVDYIKREIKLQKRIKHPYIIRLYHYFENTKNIYLILEYAEKGSLFHYLRKRKKLSEEEAFIFFFQAAIGIDYLHKKNILHRDLKPENLLLDVNKNIKVCDFGWSAEFSGSKRQTYCGTIDYMSPEMVKGLPYDHSVDIWSLGVLLFELL